MKTYLTTKIERRRARAVRKSARQGNSYGKRNAHVRAANIENRDRLIRTAHPADLRSFRNSRPVAPERAPERTDAEPSP